MAAEEASSNSSMANEYDAKAEEYDWRGPEVVFGLSYAFINPGESVLDIGIGTGLGSLLFHKAGLHVYGMDISTKMLEVCKRKKFTTDIKEHDLTVEPYPYDTASLDHAVSLGVFHFFRDLYPVFRQVARIVRDNGIFVFVVGDRSAEEETELVVGPEHTQTDSNVTMYLHGTEEIVGILEDNDFVLLRSLEFPVPMDRERTKVLRAKAHVARRKSRI
jgi:SAM-dependent methyltransferase